MSTYAGFKASGMLRGFGGASGDAHIAAQTAVLRERIIKTWTAERKEVIRKYQAKLSNMRKVSDSINEFVENKRGLTLGEMEKIQKDFEPMADEANTMLKELVKDYADRMIKAGVTTSLGYNFYDLRGPAFLIYPVNTPFRNMLPRWGRQNAGVGTAVNWKYTSLAPGSGAGSNNYAGAQEGERVGYSLPNENNAVATYSELGTERSVSFTADFAGEGYTDNVSDEHLRGAHELWLQEESIIIGGNAGTATGLNGFALGTANTPSTSLAASIPSNSPNDGSTAGFTNGTNVSVFVIELTMLGNPANSQYGYQTAPTVGATGLVPTYVRTNADATTNTINGGMGAVSAGSNVSGALTSTPYVKAIVAPKKGAFAWAWYVDDQDATTPTKSTAYLAAITTVPFCYFGANSAHTLISGNQAASATGLNTDHSSQSLDFTGIIGWGVNNGAFINMSDLTSKSAVTGATNTGLLTPGLTNSTNSVPACAEIEYDLKQQWNAFQAVADEIWCSADAKLSIEACLFKNTSGVPAYRFEVSRDQQGNLLGGFVVSGYKNQYSMKETGSEEIPLRIHPMLEPGTILYRKTRNPYPHSRIPGVSGMFVQRDYYGVEWPITTRAWTFGSYVHETYGDYIPGLITIRTGILGSA